MLVWKLGFILRKDDSISSSVVPQECCIFLARQSRERSQLGSEIGPDINGKSSHRFTVCFIPSGFWLLCLVSVFFPSPSSTFWVESVTETISFHLNTRKKSSEFLVLQVLKGSIWKSSLDNRMKLSCFWHGYNPCPSPSLPREQLLHILVTLPFLRNVPVPFQVQLVHLQNELKSHPAPYPFWVAGLARDASWLRTEQQKLIG